MAAPHPFANMLSQSRESKYIGARLTEASNMYVKGDDAYLTYFTLLARFMIFCGDIKYLTGRCRIWQYTLDTPTPTCYTERQSRISNLQQVLKAEIVRFIQAKWRSNIANPFYQVCQNRLMHEFTILGQFRPAETELC